MSEDPDAAEAPPGDQNPNGDLPEASRATRAVTLGALLGSLLALAAGLRSQRNRD